MTARFSGLHGQQRLLEELGNSRIVANEAALALALAAVGQVMAYDAGEVLMRQNDVSDGVYFVLDGALEIVANGRRVNVRGPRDCVGEMATVSAAQLRSATVKATRYCVVFKVDPANFLEIGDRFPAMWRRIAQDLSRRLEERNALIRVPNEIVRLFLISSSEAEPIAKAIKAELAPAPFETKLWSDGVFGLSATAMESLEDELLKSDFAVAIAHPDDLAKVRGKKWKAPRDNVVFELGLFMGRLGRKRTILMEPKKEPVKLPSDILGVTTLRYDFKRSKPAASIAPACEKLRAHIEVVGRFIP